jgi:hypothetical protein
MMTMIMTSVVVSMAALGRIHGQLFWRYHKARLGSILDKISWSHACPVLARLHLAYLV